MLTRSVQRGISLIEIVIGIAIVMLVLFLGVPSFGNFLQNQQVRNAAEATVAGLTLARAEAVRRNSPVRFQFVSSLTSGCVLTGSSLAWIVSVADPVGACDAAPSDTAGPQIVQKRSGTEGSANVTTATTGGAVVNFNGLGRAVAIGGVASFTQVDLSNATGVCEHVDPNGKIRCLRVTVSSGGQVKMCDPKVSTAGPPYDPRACI